MRLLLQETRCWGNHPVPHPKTSCAFIFFHELFQMSPRLQRAFLCLLSRRTPGIQVLLLYFFPCSEYSSLLLTVRGDTVLYHTGDTRCFNLYQTNSWHSDSLFGFWWNVMLTTFCFIPRSLSLPKLQKSTLSFTSHSRPKKVATRVEGGVKIAHVAHRFWQHDRRCCNHSN